MVDHTTRKYTFQAFTSFLLTHYRCPERHIHKEMKEIRPWQTRTHWCGHIVAHDVSWAAQTGKHLLRTQNLWPGHKICVRNKCCVRGQTGKHLCRQQCVRNNVSATLCSRLPGPIVLLFAILILPVTLAPPTGFHASKRRDIRVGLRAMKYLSSLASDSNHPMNYCFQNLERISLAICFLSCFSVNACRSNRARVSVSSSLLLA